MPLIFIRGRVLEAYLANALILSIAIRPDDAEGTTAAIKLAHMALAAVTHRHAKVSQCRETE